MARGVTPRRPAKSGRHERAAKQHPAKGVTQTKRTQKLVPISSPVGRLARRNTSDSHPTNTAKEPALSLPKGGVSASTSFGKTKGYNPIASDRIFEILKRLDQLYPDVTCALTHRDPWELLVATILSAQSTDVRVNMVTPELFKKYPTVQDFAKLEPQQLEADVRSTGFFRNKSKSVVGAARKIVNEFGGKVPENMDELLTLPGVARKTANVVLGTWFGKAEGLVVDTHVHRISRRLELTKNDDPKNDRAGFNESNSAREVDFVFPPDHLAWPQVVLCTIPEVRGLPAGEYLPRGRQNVEHGGKAQRSEGLDFGSSVSSWCLGHAYPFQLARHPPRTSTSRKFLGQCSLSALAIMR